MVENKRVKIGYFRVLSYEKKYKNFDEFYNEAKPEIYKTIIDLFDEFKKTEKLILTINLNAEISNFEWNTDFSFTKDQFIVMKRDFLPFFEENEEYEICDRILKLNSDYEKIFN